MTEKQAELKYGLKDGNYTIETHQVMNAETFKNKIANLESQRTNFEMQKGFYEAEIQRAKQAIEQSEKALEVNTKNIQFVTEDIDEAYHFLEKNHQAKLIEDIKAEAAKRKKQMEEQIQNQMGQ